MLFFSLFVLAFTLSAQKQTMPTPSAALGRLTVAGYRIYYGDNSTVSQARGAKAFQRWTAASATSVQVVIVYFTQTYRIWVKDHWETRPYRKLFHSQDYYWYDGTVFGAGSVDNIPAVLPLGAVKTGTLILDADFKRIYQTAYGDHVAP